MAAIVYGKAMAELSITNDYSRADSSEVEALTDLDVKVEGAGWRVAISVTLQSHVISFYNGSLGHNLEAHLL